MKSKKKSKVKTIKPQVDKTKTKWYQSNDWEFRENRVRKQKGKEVHPALVVGENNSTFANLGLTHQRKRGNHTNTKLSKNPNPKDKQPAYIRDDLQYHEKVFLEKVLTNYRKLPPEDIEKINKILNKKR